MNPVKKPTSAKRSSSKGSLEKTPYRGVYKRLNPDGKVTGYAIKPRFGGYVGKGQTFSRLTDARTEMERIRTEVKDGRLRGNGRKTVLQAIEKYLVEELPLLAVTERRNRRRHLDWWAKLRGAELLTELTGPSLLADLRERQQGQNGGKPIAFATMRRYGAALSAVLSACVDWGWLTQNPMRGSSRRKRRKVDREQERNREITPEEWETLLVAIQDSRDSRLYPLVICARASGAREGELMKMEWRGLELNPQVYDPATGQMRPGVPRCLVAFNKNGDEKMLYFPGEAGEILRELARHRGMSPYVFDLAGGPLRRCQGSGAATPYGYPAGCEVCFAIFPDRKLKAVPDHHPVPEFPHGAFRYAKKRAQIVDLRFHDLRAAWAQNLLDTGGVSDADAMILGGWKTVGMVRRYAKRAHRQGMAAVERMSR